MIWPNLRALAIGGLVSLLEQQEAAELGLADEGKFAKSSGIEFLNFPIKDYGLPEPQAFCQFVGTVRALVISCTHVAVHCRASIGRTGVTTCCLLQSFGLSAHDALELVSEARGVRVPDTDDQRRFVYDFAGWYGGTRASPN